jgi:hypothetical protein
MSDGWLDQGHGDGLALALVASGERSEPVGDQRPGSTVWRSRSGRAAVGVVVAAALIGSAGTAYAIRETLFPSIGAPTARSVWQNPVPLDEPAPPAGADTSVTSTTSTSVTTSSTTPAQPTTVPSTAPAGPVAAPPSAGAPHTITSDDSGGSGSDDSDVARISDDPGSGHPGSDEPGSDDPGSDDPGSDDPQIGVDNSGSGSGSHDSSESDSESSGSSGSSRSGSDDDVDTPED